MLWDGAGKVPRLTEEATINYWRIARFAMGMHAIHIQAHQDREKKWLTTMYKLADEELDSIIDE